MTFTLDLDELRTHQARLQDITDRADQVTRTAQELSLSGLTLYGVFCSPIVVPPLAFACAADMRALAAMAQVMQRRTQAIKQVGDDYEATEQANRDAANQTGQIVEC
ncbi:hypothetical protein [Granulicoccus phenolivorans]|uniref:hypothetical protein n=1 Tax=Granulicoccus phenolivorans TaxID=266854 RepID=UPI00040CD195|nr:hypothetical protein [Granulicoccus phenolivorans]